MGRRYTNGKTTYKCNQHSYWPMAQRHTHATSTAMDQRKSYTCNYDSSWPVGELFVQLRQLWTNGRTTCATTDDSYGPMGEWHVQLRQLWTSRNDTCNYDRYRPMEESHVQILQLPTNGRMTHSATDTGADDMHNAWMTSDNSALFRPSVWHPTQCTKASLNLSLLSNSFHSKESNLETV